MFPTYRPPQNINLHPVLFSVTSLFSQISISHLIGYLYYAQTLEYFLLAEIRIAS